MEVLPLVPALSKEKTHLPIAPLGAPTPPTLGLSPRQPGPSPPSPVSPSQHLEGLFLIQVLTGVLKEKDEETQGETGTQGDPGLTKLKRQNYQTPIPAWLLPL